MVYSLSAVNVLSGPYIGYLPRIKISFFLLSICTDELISAPNMMTLSPNPLPSDNRKLRINQNPMPLPKILYLSELLSVVNLTAPDHKFPNVRF